MCPRCTHLPCRPNIMQAVLKHHNSMKLRSRCVFTRSRIVLPCIMPAQCSVKYKRADNAAICGKEICARCRVVRERHRSAAGCKLSTPIMCALSPAGADHTHTAPCTKPHRAGHANVVLPHTAAFMWKCNYASQWPHCHHQPRLQNDKMRGFVSERGVQIAHYWLR